ncbi:methionyl-tRNA formyltransferase [Candidatus Entotheonella palauensis]|uniref:methionyl-tRNA formyltransferase n=1 Tax=Candidatus Entotheonella palauensis TaxID=93172 RepID=UPI000B7CD46A|nr:methionyl-tRNA formyltransferase [Candidatus Entotheonella palauensis]
MRFLFMGTAEFACPTLQALVASEHEVLAVVTQPDRPRGRGRQPAMTPVKRVALELDLNVPILQPARLRRSEVIDELAAFEPDVIVVVAYGNILPPRVLALPPHGCVNLHGSLLPKYRGAAPINWALMHGDTESGYTIIQMDEHVDTGPMLSHEAFDVPPDEDAISLGQRMAELGAKGMVGVLSALEQGGLQAQPQPEEGASQAPKLTREMGRLDWCEPACSLHNRVRGLVPWPGCTALYGDLEVKIWRTAVDQTPETAPPGTVVSVAAEGIRVACGDRQQLLIQDIQPANRRRMTAQAFAQGYRLQQGDCFG